MTCDRYSSSFFLLPLSILTVPAVNSGAVKQKGKQSESEIDRIENIMFDRTENYCQLQQFTATKF
ncbi:MAG: hypothetical protein HC849_29000 [Oscillatoriales cyanobacterium RU_3_3]|nr:hypothetical protein [Oscillatoriales cyanobacterium RU_3_3]